MSLSPQASLQKAQPTDQRKAVRQAERDAWNRLHSALEDARWVDSIADRFPELPVLPNLRCGAWYVSPRHRDRLKGRSRNGAYFKSTDGHHGQWAFSLKRCNLDLVETIQDFGGCIIVDSTRRGKSMPDALSKTVPLWCAVLNAASRARYDDKGGSGPERGQASTSTKAESGAAYETLRTPEDVVPPSEHAQMEQRLGPCVERFLSSDLPIPRLSKPLRPLFVTPAKDADLSSLKSSVKELPYHPVVLVSASRFSPTPVVEEGEERGHVYVQGSGDDEEGWARGLTPDIFWDEVWRGQRFEEARTEWLLGSRSLFEERLERLVERGRRDGPTAVETLRRSFAAQDLEGEASSVEDPHRTPSPIGTTGIWLCRRLPEEDLSRERCEFDVVVHCDARGSSTTSEQRPGRGPLLRLGLPQGKKGLPALRKAIPDLLTRISPLLAASTVPSSPSPPRLLLLCASDVPNLASSLAVSILATFYDASQRLLVLPLPRSLTKAEVQRRLQWLVTALPWAAPSRTFLLRVNEALLSPSHRPVSSDSRGEGGSA